MEIYSIQYTNYFFLLLDFHPLQAALNTTCNAMFSLHIPLGILVKAFTCVLTIPGSIPLALVLVFRRSFVRLIIVLSNAL